MYSEDHQDRSGRAVVPSEYVTLEGQTDFSVLKQVSGWLIGG